MIEFLTRTPLVRAVRKLFESFSNRGDNLGSFLKIFTCFFFIGFSLLFYRALGEFRGYQLETGTLPSAGPLFGLIGTAVGTFLSFVAFLTALWVKNYEAGGGNRSRLIVTVLWIVALASLAAWIPNDVADFQAAITGRALAGEDPPILTYLGKLFLVGFVILSIPIAAMLFFRLSIMDQYVVKAFLTPFTFCMVGFIVIWVIFDFTDNGSAFSGLGAERVMTFYIVQVPFVVLFVMPIVVLLSALFALSNLSKSNELISMISAGRSVLRILMPLLVAGAYCSIVCLAFKYEWAPKSVGYKDALLKTALEDQWLKQTGRERKPDIWARRGWLYVNEVDRRTWFVGFVPLELSSPMADIIVWQLNDEGRPTTVWKAKRGKWNRDVEPPVWNLSDVKVYQYREDHVPEIDSYKSLDVPAWSETPWKVLSSSQDPEYLGLSGLSTYLKANRKMDKTMLAPFWTNWWYIFAEPLSCLVMIMVAAPLGIVYSRRGVMGGVTGAILIFALMYLMRGTFLALGQGAHVSPFIAAWGTNLVVGTIGVVLIWFRARNRDVPTLKGLWKKAFASS